MAGESEPKAPIMGEPVGGAPKPADDPKAYLQFFPEAIRGEKTLEKFSGKDANEVLGKVATSYINLEKHAGGAVRIPGEGATKEEVSAFREKLGVPKDVADYGIALKDLKIPEGVAIDEAGLGKFLSWAHGEGFTKAQVGKIIDRFVQTENARVDAATRANAANAGTAYAEVQKEWGALTDRNVALVQRGVREFGGDEFAALLDSSGMGNDPRFLRFALKVFQPMMEDGLIAGENLGMRSGDASGEIKQIMSSEAYQGKKGREEQLAAVEKIRALSAIAYSDAV